MLILSYWRQLAWTVQTEIKMIAVTRTRTMMLLMKMRTIMGGKKRSDWKGREGREGSN